MSDPSSLESRLAVAHHAVMEAVDAAYRLPLAFTGGQAGRYARDAWSRADAAITRANTALAPAVPYFRLVNLRGRLDDADSAPRSTHDRALADAARRVAGWAPGGTPGADGPEVEGEYHVSSYKVRQEYDRAVLEWTRPLAARAASFAEVSEAIVRLAARLRALSTDPHWAGDRPVPPDWGPRVADEVNGLHRSAHWAARALPFLPAVPGADPGAVLVEVDRAVRTAINRVWYRPRAVTGAVPPDDPAAALRGQCDRLVAHAGVLAAADRPTTPTPYQPSARGAGPAVVAVPAVTLDQLTESARCVVQALVEAGRPLTGSRLAVQAGVGRDYVRHVARSLKSLRLIENTPDGYALTPEGQRLVNTFTSCDTHTDSHLASGPNG